MSTILKRMQDTVVKYANVLSEVLKVDVEIVDDKLNRIAGTGKFKGKINRNMAEEGYVYMSVIKTGERKIIDRPGEHEICNHCYKKNNCDEFFEISTPIKLNNEVIGVMGFICFDDVQKKHLSDNLETFLKFSEQIADLISSKAKEQLESEKMYIFIDLMNGIIDRIEDGVVIVNEENKAVKINTTGANILKLNNRDDAVRLNFKPTGKYSFNKQEYQLDVKDNSFILIGEEYIIRLDPGHYNRILIFNDIENIKEKVYSIAYTKKDIGLDEIIGNSEKILRLKENIIKIAKHSSTTLITGESGTGKELFARAIHMNSNRARSPFVTINCGAIPDSLLESELFGYVKGAFTGADPKGKIGKFELAHKGTIFLDEIGDLPLYMQVKLLRVIQEKKIFRIGSNEGIDVDARIIAATNKNLELMIKDKTFREDLYYRINVIPLHIPPLRERKEDVGILTKYFVKKYSQLFNKKVLRIDKEIWDYFYKYDWPGNVRELENTVEFMINMMGGKGILSMETLPKNIVSRERKGHKNIDLEKIHSLNLSNIERKVIETALEIYGTSTEGKKAAAWELGIGIATLYRKLDLHNLSK